jgi:hypothetical protein
MNRSPFVLAGALLAILAAGGNSEAQQDAPKAKESQVTTVIRAQKATSYAGDHGLTICDLTKPTIHLKGMAGKVKELTLSGETATTESKSGEGPCTITMKGNVRAEEGDGTITTADEAVVDLTAGTFTYTGKVVRVVTSGK